MPRTAARRSAPTSKRPPTPQQKSAQWARTMVKVQITKVATRRGWEIANFLGKGGRESRGIVDLLAIRKDHAHVEFPRGDLFEMILIQVKGGSSRWPTQEEVDRLRAVARRYHARDVVLGARTVGRMPTFYRLTAANVLLSPRDPWEETDAHGLFR